MTMVAPPPSFSPWNASAATLFQTLNKSESSVWKAAHFFSGNETAAVDKISLSEDDTFG